jgi:hypothetical protein
MAELRALIEGNPWLTLYALLYACEASELGALNNIVDATRRTRGSTPVPLVTRADALEAERFQQ